MTSMEPTSPARWRLAVAAVVAATEAIAAPARAAFVAPTGWARGAGASTYQAWDAFGSPAGPNAPDLPGRFPAAATFPGSAAPNAYDTSGNGFIPGSGNIYSFSGPLNISVDVPGYNTGAASITTVLLQTRTQGTEPVYAGPGGVRLTYAGGAGPVTLFPVGSAELARVPLGGFGGDQVDRAYLFHVPADPAALRLQLDASGSSMSMDQIYVDTVVTPAAGGYPVQPVPEPAAAGLVAAAAGAGLLGRRRRRLEGRV